MNNTKSASRVYLGKFFRSFIFTWTVFGIAACSDDVDQPAFQPEYLVDYEVVATIKRDDVLADNDIYDWRPAIPLQLYHGTDDMLVTYMNAVTTLEAMNQAGAVNVELFTVEGGTHLSTFWDYLFGTFSFFLPLAFS